MQNFFSKQLEICLINLIFFCCCDVATFKMRIWVTNTKKNHNSFKHLMLQCESCIIPHKWNSCLGIFTLSQDKHPTVPTTRRKINSVPAAADPLRDGIFSSLSPNVSEIIPSTFFCQSVLFCGLSSFFVSHWN